MSISSVATRIGIALDPHTKNFIRSELSVRRNEMWAQGCSWLLEDEFIEGLLEDLNEGRESSFQQGNTVRTCDSIAKLSGGN